MSRVGMSLGTLVFSLGVWTLAFGQAPPLPGSTCDAIVSEQYRALVAAQLLPAASEGQVLAPAQYALLIASQLRIERTKYDMEEQYTKLAKGNIAHLLEQLRQRTLEVQALQGEVERLKNGSGPPDK